MKILNLVYVSDCDNEILSVIHYKNKQGEQVGLINNSLLKKMGLIHNLIRLEITNFNFSGMFEIPVTFETIIFKKEHLDFFPLFVTQLVVDDIFKDHGHIRKIILKF